MVTRPNDPAFPCPVDSRGNLILNGLTKREYFAALIFAQADMGYVESVKYADKLIEQLNKSELSQKESK